MTVVSLEKTSAEHITVHFSDGSEIRSTLGAVTNSLLCCGKELTAEEYRHFAASSENFLALEKGYSLVATRQMSGKELKGKLAKSGCGPEAIEFCVSKLYESGYLDDERYAGAVARHYSARGYGPARLRQEFYKRGIPKELWEDAIESLPEDDERIDAILERRLKDPNDKDEVRKAANYLFRRGYRWDDIRSAIARYSDSYFPEDDST